MAVAEELARRLPHAERGEITLVDRYNFSVFTPMLTEVVGGQIDPRHVGASLRQLAPPMTFVAGDVTAIDLAARRVTVQLRMLTGGIKSEERELVADHLVIALGSVTAYHDVPGLREHSVPMKSLRDASAIHDRALGLLDRADAETDPAKRRRLLTFVVGGGGYSGVETMAALNDLLRESVRHYRHIDEGDIRTILAHSEERLLPELGARLAAYSQRELARRDVDIRLNTKITGAGEGWVKLGDEEIPASMLIWTAGVAPSPAIANLDAPLGDHHGLRADRFLRVSEYPGVWALGDCAEVPRRRGGTYAPTAQNATREGKLAARNIVATLRGKTLTPFNYRPLGQLALVGRRAGVAELRGWRFSGLFAWFLWRSIYWAKLPTFQDQARVGLDWFLDLVFGRQLVVPPLQDPDPTQEQSP